MGETEGGGIHFCSHAIARTPAGGTPNTFLTSSERLSVLIQTTLHPSSSCSVVRRLTCMDCTNRLPCLLLLNGFVKEATGGSLEESMAEYFPQSLLVGYVSYWLCSSTEGPWFLKLPFLYSHSLQVVSLVATTPTVASLRKLHHHFLLSLYPARVLVNSLIINSTRLFRMSVPSVSCCDDDCYTW